MAAEGLTFPIPLPVILKEGEAKPASETTAQEIKELLEKELELQESYLGMAGIDSREERKDRRDDRKRDKIKDKLTKQWDKLGITKYFKGLLTKIGILAVGLAAMGGGFLSGLFNDIMELMLFAAVDPNGGLLGSFINAIIPLFLNLVTMVINILVKLLPVIIKTFVKMIPTFLKAIIGVIGALIDAIPMIIDAFIVATPLIIDALFKATPKIIMALMDGVLKSLDALVKAFPAFKPIADFVAGIANAVKTLFSDDPSKTFGEKIRTFLKSILENLLTGIKDIFVALFNYIGQEFGTLGQIILMALIAIAGFILFPIIGLPLLIAAAIGLIILYWDDLVKWFSNVWNSFTSWLGSAWDSLVKGISEAIDWMIDIIITAFRILMLPFTWPLELALYVWKNWKKISKLIDAGLQWLLNIIGSIFGDKIKQKLQNFLNWIKSFNPGEIISSTINSALTNIPGLNTIRNFFHEIGEWLADKLSFFGDGDKRDTFVASIDKTIERIAGKPVDDRIAEYVKKQADSGKNIESAELSKMGFDVSQDLLEVLKGVKESYSKSYEGSGADRKVNTSKMEELLAEVVKTNKSKSQSSFTVTTPNSAKAPGS